MSLVSKLRDNFSSYELAAAGRLLHPVLALVVIIAITKSLVLLAVAAATLLATSVITIWLASLCQESGKSPLQAHHFPPDSTWNFWFPLRLFWPERICSDCGARLDEG